MNNWEIEETPAGLRLKAPTERAFGSDQFTWAYLLYGKLVPVKVYVVYFPSRFDLPVDTSVERLLSTFGGNTGVETSVNFWDSRDVEFSRALDLFGLKSPPALVLATGLEIAGIEPYGPNKAALYTISITDDTVLSDQQRLIAAVNASHDILVRCDPKEITAYLRANAAQKLLEAIGKAGAGLRDQVLLFKPKLSLPGDVSIQLGG